MVHNKQMVCNQQTRTTKRTRETETEKKPGKFSVGLKSLKIKKPRKNLEIDLYTNQL